MHICHLYADGWRDAVAPATASHRRARRRRRASDAEAPDRAVRRVLFGDQFRTHRERRAQHDYTPRRAAAEQEAEEMPLPLRHRTYAKHAAQPACVEPPAPRPAPPAEHRGQGHRPGRVRRRRHPHPARVPALRRRRPPARPPAMAAAAARARWAVFAT